MSKTTHLMDRTTASSGKEVSGFHGEEHMLLELPPLQVSYSRILSTREYRF